MPGVAEVAAPDGSLTRAETPLAALPSAVEIDQRSLALFRADIIGAAKRFRRYPRMALDSNWEGTTRIRIAFNKEGKRASIAVAQSAAIVG